MLQLVIGILLMIRLQVKVQLLLMSQVGILLMIQQLLLIQVKTQQLLGQHIGTLVTIQQLLLTQQVILIQQLHIQLVKTLLLHI